MSKKISTPLKKKKKKLASEVFVKLEQDVVIDELARNDPTGKERARRYRRTLDRYRLPVLGHLA